jgi:hypothetical protein
MHPSSLPSTVNFSSERQHSSVRFSFNCSRKALLLDNAYILPKFRYGHTTSDSGLVLTLTSVPHIGHLYTLVTTDIISRHARLALPDRAVHFLTGTDEHGLKIQRAAEEQDLEPRQFCDRISDRFRVCSTLVGAFLHADRH